MHIDKFVDMYVEMHVGMSADRCIDRDTLTCIDRDTLTCVRADMRAPQILKHARCHRSAPVRTPRTHTRTHTHAGMVVRMVIRMDGCVDRHRHERLPMGTHTLASAVVLAAGSEGDDHLFLEFQKSRPRPHSKRCLDPTAKGA